jgi:hypothetical protein
MTTRFRILDLARIVRRLIGFRVGHLQLDGAGGR